MCEISGKHKLLYRLEVFSSPVTVLTEDEMRLMVANHLLAIETELNAGSIFRWHIHEVP